MQATARLLSESICWIGLVVINVLQIVPSLASDSGVTRFVLNMNRYIDRDRFHFDFFHHSSESGRLIFPNSLDDELKAEGSSAYVVSHGKTSPFEFAREATDVLGRVASKYDIAHCHVPNNAFVTLRACQHSGVGVRIIHSHLNASSDNAIHRLRNAPLIALGKRFANAYSACSDEAGRYLFGDSPFELINNGICLDDYAYSVNDREALRAELGISENAPVIGCVGRFVKQKNYLFAIDVFAAYVKDVPEARLVILGGGEERRTVEDKITSLGLSGKVFLPGIRSDVARFYSVFDVFFMPSLYEGLPISAVEAQAAGLPCVFSSNVPIESDIVGNASFIDCGSSLEEWISGLSRAIRDGREMYARNRLAKAGYSVEANAEKLMEYYEELLKRVPGK